MTATVDLEAGPTTEEFLGKVLGDTSGTTITVLATIGDKLGLFKELAARGPATSNELATRSHIDERYAREWLAGMTTAGYLSHDPATGQFELPAAHVPVLAQEGGPEFFGGVHQMLSGMVAVQDRLVDAFRHGGGVPQSAYGDDLWDGIDRFTAGWFENLFLQDWLPRMPEVTALLERGARVADVGCGRGRALLKLASVYPTGTYVGYDVFAPTIDRATATAAAAQVSDRVRFEARDVSKGLPETYDVITTFDVVHDAADPLGMLTAIREALRPGGRYVCLDINCTPDLAGNAGPLGSFFYGASLLYCMTTSLAAGGEGLGTLGLHPHKLDELCAKAGFASVRLVEMDNPFNNLYVATP